mmetsp:Transcript_13023/g.48299  ORF Transcript_13023/g.48299 Transcript_13023/m.48299 type:complete len:268 (+) Transcript_13023:1008-1811(+)
MLPAVVEHPAHLRDDAPDRHPQRHALAHDQGPLAHHLGDVYGQIEILPNVHAEHDLPRDPQRGQVHHGRDVHALPLVRLQQPRDALVRVLAHGLDVVLQVRRVEELGEERVIVPVLVALAGHQALAKERAEHMRVVLRLGHPAIRQYLPHGRRIGDMQQGLMANEERPNPSVSLPLVAHVANVAELADDAQDVADQRQRRRARKGAEPPHVDQHRCGAVQRQQRHRCDQQRDRRQQLRKVWRRSRHRCADVGSSAVRPWAAAEKARD